MREACRELAGRLDELLPSDPAMAAVLAEEMAEAFADGAEEKTISNNASAAPSTATVNMDGPPAGDKAGGTEALANSESECRAKDPAHCPVHGTPASSAPSAKDDGKDKAKRAIPGIRSNKAANDAAVDAGYPGGVREILDKAAKVPAERVAQIQGGYKGTCDIHEAVAVMAENKPFPDISDEMITFRDNQIEKYLTGAFRKSGKPKPENLKDLPLVIQAVRTDEYAATRIKFPEGAVPDYLDPPWGTQREYHIDTGRGILSVFVYVRNNVINGWHIPD